MSCDRISLSSDAWAAVNPSHLEEIRQEVLASEPAWMSEVVRAQMARGSRALHVDSGPAPARASAGWLAGCAREPRGSRMPPPLPRSEDAHAAAWLDWACAFA